jgi:predicted transcriptional regulator
MNKNTCKRKTMTFQIDEDLNKKVRAHAKARRVSSSDVIRAALLRFFEPGEQQNSRPSPA